ncbi:MAG: methyltransferase domain-containing protein [Pseudomonadota bacterium]|nr:methyltransferase domain-containing protein [Pseudomonadota bacterium]
MKAGAEKLTMSKLEKTLYEGEPFSISQSDEYPGLVKAWGLGVLRQYLFYHLCLNKMMKNVKNKNLQMFLLLALFRLDSQEKDHAKLVNHLVDKAKALHLPSSTVNAVLRKYLLDKSKFAIKSRGVASIQYNMREDLLGRLKKQHSGWRDLVRTMQQEPRVCLKVNREKISDQAFKEALNDKSLAFVAGDVPGSIVLEKPQNIQKIPGYEEGWFSVVSEANQKLQSFLPSKTVSRVLDACAAPGGKAMMLREQYGPDVEIVATDNDTTRLATLEDNNKRLGLNLKCQQRDWLMENSEEEEGEFDLVWADVPCSATGVISKHPEIAVCSRDDVKNLPVQREILKRLWSSLKPGGELVYTTCSLLEEENGAMVQWFLGQARDAEVIQVECEESGLPTAQHGRYFTSQHSHDYIFFCMLKKSVNS